MQNLLIHECVRSPFSKKRVLSTTPVAAILPYTAGSSHEPVYIYSETNAFLGMVWLYELMYTSKPQTSTQVGKYAVKLPRFTGSSTLYDVAQCMVDNRVYEVPVYTQGDITGTVSARDMMKYILRTKELTDTIIPHIAQRPVATTSSSKTVRAVYTTMREDKLSRMVLVDDHGKIRGIVTRADLFRALFTNNPHKQRYHSPALGGQGTMEFDEEVVSKFDVPLIEFASTNVVQAPSDTPTKQILSQLLSHRSNSVILTDRSLCPQAMITMRSFLMACTQLKPTPSVAIAITDRSKTIDYFHEEEMKEMLGNFAKKIHRRNPLSKIQVVVSALKKKEKGAAIYQFRLHITQQNGRFVTSDAQGSNIRQTLHSACEKIERIME